jgi:hypothetical protein
MIRACRCHKAPHVNHSPNCIVVVNPTPYILYDVKVVHCLDELIYYSPLVHVQAKATLKVLSPKNLLYWRERLPAKLSCKGDDVANSMGCGPHNDVIPIGRPSGRLWKSMGLLSKRRGYVLFADG